MEINQNPGATFLLLLSLQWMHLRQNNVWRGGKWGWGYNNAPCSVRGVISYCVISYYVISCNVTLYHISYHISYHTISYRIYCIVSYCIILYYMILWYIIPYYIKYSISSSVLCTISYIYIYLIILNRTTYIFCRYVTHCNRSLKASSCTLTFPFQPYVGWSYVQLMCKINHYFVYFAELATNVDSWINPVVTSQTYTSSHDTLKSRTNTKSLVTLLEAKLSAISLRSIKYPSQVSNISKKWWWQ